MSDIAHFEIPIYDFPVDPEEDDQDTVEENMAYRRMLPFAVIGSEKSGGTYVFDHRQKSWSNISLGKSRSR